MDNQSEKTNNLNVGLIKSVLSTEVKFVLTVVGFAFGIVKPYYEMKQDMAIMKNDLSNINANHEVHIQDMMQDIKEIKTQELNQNALIIELQKNILILNTKK